jgi:hypothetical protein
VPAPPTAPVVSITQPNCTTATGTITVTSPAGTGIVYSIDGLNYQSGNVFTGISAGVYSVKARNTLTGCLSAATQATVNPQPATPSAPQLSVVQPSCAQPTGTITVTDPLGSGLTYSINGSTYQANPVFSGLTGGTYNVTVRNSSLCTSSPVPAVINTSPAVAAPAVTVTQPTCTSPSGTITVTSPIGTGITYSINGGTTFQASTVFNNVPPGNYSVVAANAVCTSPVTGATVNAVPSCPAGIYQSTITCAGFNQGASKLSQICYTVQSGKIKTVTPASFSYYYTLNAPSASFTLDIVQTSQTTGFAPFNVLTSGGQAQVFLYNTTCGQILTGTTPTAGQARLAVANAVAGDNYVVCVKYTTSNLIGTSGVNALPQGNYSFSARIATTTLSGSTASLALKGGTCTVQRNVDGVLDPAYPVVAYPNPTSGDVKISYETGEAGPVTLEVYDQLGRSVYSFETYHDSEGQYQLEVPLGSSGLASGLYLVRLTRSDNVDELRIILNR